MYLQNWNYRFKDKSVFLRKNDSGVPRFSWNTKSSAACSSQFYSWENESAFEKNTATQQVVKIHELLYSQLIHEEKKNREVDAFKNKLFTGLCGEIFSH